MPTRVILIEFNPDVSSAQIEAFQHELSAVADKIPYKKSFRCGMNRKLETEGALDSVAPEVHVPQFAAIWEFGSYEDLARFVGELVHKEFAAKIAKAVIRRRWVVNV